jgi:1-pyrroline-5-carboxylate dehydrogenase
MFSAIGSVRSLYGLPTGLARRHLSTRLSWATVDPSTLSGANPGRTQNYVNGVWTDAAKTETIVDPMNGEPFLQVPDTQIEELTPFLESLAATPKSGVHNPLKRPERYAQYGEVSGRLAEALRTEEVAHFFATCIQRVCPKSYIQAANEVNVVRLFLENFSGDQVRFLARGFHVAGDHAGQQTNGYRWPYGGVAVISPFNFPLEIPVLQLMGALYMGNKVVLKGTSSTSLVLDQWLRLMEYCGAPMPEDTMFLNASGPVTEHLVREAAGRDDADAPYRDALRTIQFTGSSAIAERLSTITRGKVKIEDAGFDWKILGPDVGNVDYVVWQCDQDAYACSGQKCSAQSLLLAHENWLTPDIDLLGRLKETAASRSLDNLTIGPVLTKTTTAMLDHVDALLKIPGARLLFGGKELAAHSIPPQYGAIEPTAVFVPLDQLLTDEHFDLCTTEIFGPLQIVSSYVDDDVAKLLEVTERLRHHLTAAIVSNDLPFVQHLLSRTLNGTTYVGRAARTTGAPQNHWFGPAGDPRAAGIGSPEAIRAVWSCHREIVTDYIVPDPDAEDMSQS